MGNVLAIASVGVDVYYFHGLYYLMLVPGFREMPILAHIIGVGFFFFYLMVVWFVASGSHNLVFGRQGDSRAFIAENLRANIPIGLPWVVVSFCVDFLKVLPVPWLHDLMVDGSGEFFVFGLFFVFLVLVFPPLLMKIWQCKPIPQGRVRDELVAMCERLHLKYRDILMWPLFGGQVLTAGVVGFVARFRYLLITNGLLRNLTGEEIESVIAHETGHVKYHHMQLYLFILMGFSFIIAPVLCGINYVMFQTGWAFSLMDYWQVSVTEFVEINETVVLFVLMVLFLRFVFGFFMRNFERQADLHAFQTTGGSRYIISALEKVAILSGDIRDLPSWHHFGIGQRVDFLLDCQHDPSRVKKHHQKVFRMLLAYGLLIVISVASYVAIPADYLENSVADQLEGTLLSEVARSPENAELYWALGDFYYRQHRYSQAIQAYDDSLALQEDNAELHNNLAWLYVTCEDPAFLDFQRGLAHAHRAVALRPAPHILDTYAHALWLNDRRNEALLIEQQALQHTKKEHYKVQFRRQIEIWKRQGS